MLRDRVKRFLVQEAPDEQEPKTYTNVRWIEMEELTARILSDEGYFTINDVVTLKMAELAKVEIKDFDYDPDQLMFYIKFKKPVTVLVERGRAQRGMLWVRLLVF